MFHVTIVGAQLPLVLVVRERRFVYVQRSMAAQPAGANQARPR